MRGVSKSSCVVLLLYAMPLLVLAAEDTNLKELNQQSEELKQRNESQNKVLRVLQKRLRRMEASLQRQTVPARQVAPPKGGATPAIQPAPARQTAPAMSAREATQAGSNQRPAGGVDQSAGTGTAGSGAEEPVVKKAPINQGVEVLLQEEHTLFAKRLTVEPGFSYAHSNRRQLNLSGFLVLDAIFLGRINVDEVSADILVLDLTIRYGITDRLQVDLNLPFLYRNTNYQSEGVGGASNFLSETDVTLDPTLGDINFGIFYQLFRETPNWPDTVLNIRVKEPTGTDPFGIKIIQPDPNNTNLQVPQELPSGNGVWTVSGGLSFVKTVDPAIVFANFNYFYNFEQSFDDIETDPEKPPQPGTVDLGNSYQFDVGAGFALSERMAMSFLYSQRLTEKSRTKPQGGEFASIVGSNANAASFTVGLTYALSERLSMITNVGIGMTPDAPDVLVNMKFPYTL
jgi:hypothetical protein